MATYLIYNEEESQIQNEPMYWSNEHGWVDLDQADFFTEEERKTLNLPAFNSEWREILETP